MALDFKSRMIDMSRFANKDNTLLDDLIFGKIVFIAEQIKLIQLIHHWSNESCKFLDFILSSKFYFSTHSNGYIPYF